jgi:hypothetical protein
MFAANPMHRREDAGVSRTSHNTLRERPGTLRIPSIKDQGRGLLLESHLGLASPQLRILRHGAATSAVSSHGQSPYTPSLRPISSRE